ncbi:hypothetical protein BS50DRAFT_284680 [Corynespora cassiicola Philippines]|uniref:BZIP domain-containing protein n=1 Tax=Corynespora cassiicola Philippines TaxID=1448308 RepID=A0A2T2P1G4_CORCC|nr:hypothetical protein BS50DRAFT_284680 [Corynespora cassiicola Philippines]
MQAISGFQRTEKHMDYQAPSECSDPFGTRDDWEAPPHVNNVTVSKFCPTNYMALPAPILPTSEGQAVLEPADAKTPIDPPQRGLLQTPPTGFHVPLQGEIEVKAEKSPPGTGPSIYHQHYNNQPGASFKPLSKTPIASQDACTLPPLDTHSIAPDSFDPSQSFFYDIAPGSFTSTHAPSSESAFSSNSPSLKRRSESTRSTTTSEASTPVAGAQSPPRRRRKSANVEPGSARAIYLEKNRKAASKCRNKQKRQQEELIITARNAERVNKELKIEVEDLRSDVRELVEMVGEHSYCSDRRLSAYIQREADRLAACSTGKPHPRDGPTGHESPDEP